MIRVRLALSSALLDEPAERACTLGSIPIPLRDSRAKGVWDCEGPGWAGLLALLVADGMLVIGTAALGHWGPSAHSYHYQTTGASRF